MKMAKATDADIEEAMDFCNAMSAITQNFSPTMPEGIGDDEGEYFDIENDRHCGRVLRHLVGLVNNASLERVVFGCAVMLDPRNKLVDPGADTIEHHPDTAAALAAMNAKTASRALSIEAARKICETGGPAVEEERLAFEAWMAGHCWELGATWNGTAYVGDREVDGRFVAPQAIHTRGLWAAWRDRAALEIMPARGDDAATNFDLDDVAATSETAKRELSSLRGLLVASHRRRERLETALRLAADEPNIDKARAIADAALKKESDE